MPSLIAMLFDADGLGLAAEPAMAGLGERLQLALGAHLDDAEASVDIPFTDLVGPADSPMLAYLLLAQLPPGMACLGAHDAAGRVHEGDSALSACAAGRGALAVFYRFDLELLRSRMKPLASVQGSRLRSRLRSTHQTSASAATALEPPGTIQRR